MAERKKKTCLSMYEKYQILQAIENGESRDMVLNKYNISERTLRRIVQHADEVTVKSKNFEFRNKKTMKSTGHGELEAALFKWFIQRRDSNQPISTPMIQEKARIFNKMLKGPATFKASDGWFSSFKKRHGLGRFPLKEEISTDGKEFSKLLNEKIMKENLKLENIYNADESGIYWKTLLHYTLELTKNSVAAGLEHSTDRFTSLFCANASGSHRLPLLIIDKLAKLRDLKNFIAGKAHLHDINYLPGLDVSYSAQENGWMNCEIFKKWYEYEFIPRVLEYQKNTEKSGKVLLILDNALSHPSKEELNAINDNFEVLFLPPNVTVLIQPMDQSLISSTKKLYKTNLMRKLLMEKDYEKMETFLKKLKFCDCLLMLSKGWSGVKQSTLKNAWKALLLHDSYSYETNTSIEQSNPIYEFCEYLAKYLSTEDEENEEISIKVKLKIEEWFNADEGDSGCEILSDEQIVQSVLNSQNNFNDFESPSMAIDETIDIYEEPISVKSEIDEDEDENKKQTAKSTLNSQYNFDDLESLSMMVEEAIDIHEEKISIPLKREINDDEDENKKQTAKSTLNSQYNFDDLESLSMMVEEAIDIHEEKISIPLKREINEDEDENKKQTTKSILNSQYNFDDLESLGMVVEEAIDIHEEKISIPLKSEIDEDKNITATEALEDFLKFKSWMMTNIQCSESQILFFNECEHTLRNAIVNSQNM